MKRILGILFLLLLVQPALPHYKARFHVIVDTDGGIDDFRAICMMLASPEIEIIAITAVDGILSPEETVGRLSSLLRHFGHEGIPLGLGKSVADKSRMPEKEAMASYTQWIKEESPVLSLSLPDAAGLIMKSIELEEMPVDIIALGPLTNLEAFLQESGGIPERVRKVYWYNDAESKMDFNYAFDAASAGAILKSGFSIDRVNGAGKRLENLDGFLASLDTATTPYACAVRELYTNPSPGFMNHIMATLLADDCIPVYMLYPEQFTVSTCGDQPLRRIAYASKEVVMAPLLLDILDSDQEDKSIIFSNFPVDPALFEEDVAPIAPVIIEKHGMKEWKIVVLTNEFHEHMGIYSILGAKMGLRAREYFHLGIDELEILSFAGSTPPVSCLNDGLQVSTGATMGHGTITLGEGQVNPKAHFTFKDRVIEINVRPDIRKKIKKDVGYGIQTYGLESTEYWEYIRKLALEYWMELDRFEIFDIRELNL